MMLFIFFSIFNLVSSDRWNPDHLERDIYTNAGDTHCFRNLNQNGTTGCATHKAGTQGVLRYIKNDTSFIHLASESPDFDITLVMKNQYLTLDNLKMLTDADVSIAGILCLQVLSEEIPTEPYSPSEQSPLWRLSPYGGEYPWNPNGFSLLKSNFSYGMVALSSSLSETVEGYAKDNEESIEKGVHAEWSAEFTYPMAGKRETGRCLDHRLCLPMGGHSVISSFSEITEEKRKIFVTAKIDTTSLFTDLARGADDAMSAVTAILVAVNALQKKAEKLRNQANKDIIFAFFDGETYDLVGSRTFMNDIQNFTCNQEMKDYSDGCWEPYHTTVDFQKIKISDIDAVIHVGPVGVKSEPNEGLQIFAHTEKKFAKNSWVNDTLQNMTAFATEIGDQEQIKFTVKKASDENPGTPPSSYWSFLEKNPDIPGIVLTDFNTEYANKYTHSVFDTLDHIEHKQICFVGKLLAKTLYQMVFNTTITAEELDEVTVESCKIVERLMNCFVNDMTCATVKEYYPNSESSFTSHYSSIYQIIEDFNVAGMNMFLLRYMAELTRRAEPDKSCTSQDECVTHQKVCSKENCVQSATYFHEAVDPNFIFDYETEKWSISENLDGVSELWTESNWVSHVGTRIFKTESGTVVVTMLIFGILVFISSMCFGYWGAQKCKQKFKIL